MVNDSTGALTQSSSNLFSANSQVLSNTVGPWIPNLLTGRGLATVLAFGNNASNQTMEGVAGLGDTNRFDFVLPNSRMLVFTNQLEGLRFIDGGGTNNQVIIGGGYSGSQNLSNAILSVTNFPINLMNGTFYFLSGGGDSYDWTNAVGQKITAAFVGGFLSAGGWQNTIGGSNVYGFKCRTIGDVPVTADDTNCQSVEGLYICYQFTDHFSSLNVTGQVTIIAYTNSPGTYLIAGGSYSNYIEVGTTTVVVGNLGGGTNLSPQSLHSTNNLFPGAVPQVVDKNLFGWATPATSVVGLQSNIMVSGGVLQLLNGTNINLATSSLNLSNVLVYGNDAGMQTIQSLNALYFNPAGGGNQAGWVAMSGSQGIIYAGATITFGGIVVGGINTPVIGTDAANKSYVNSQVLGATNNSGIVSVLTLGNVATNQNLLGMHEVQFTNTTLGIGPVTILQNTVSNLQVTGAGTINVTGAKIVLAADPTNPQDVENLETTTNQISSASNYLANTGGVLPWGTVFQWFHTPTLPTNLVIYANSIGTITGVDPLTLSVGTASFATTAGALSISMTLSSVCVNGNITGTGILFSALSSNLSHSATFADLANNTNQIRSVAGNLAVVVPSTASTNNLLHTGNLTAGAGIILSSVGSGLQITETNSIAANNWTILTNLPSFNVWYTNTTPRATWSVSVALGATVAISPQVEALVVDQTTSKTNHYGPVSEAAGAIATVDVILGSAIPLPTNSVYMLTNETAVGGTATILNWGTTSGYDGANGAAGTNITLQGVPFLASNNFFTGSQTISNSVNVTTNLTENGVAVLTGATSSADIRLTTASGIVSGSISNTSALSALTANNGSSLTGLYHWCKMTSTNTYTLTTANTFYQRTGFTTVYADPAFICTPSNITTLVLFKALRVTTKQNLQCAANTIGVTAIVTNSTIFNFTNYLFKTEGIAENPLLANISSDCGIFGWTAYNVPSNTVMNLWMESIVNNTFDPQLGNNTLWTVEGWQ